MAAAGASGLAKTYIEDVFSTYLYSGTGSTQEINNGIALGNGPANGTVLHLRADGVNGGTNNTILDSSSNNYTVTRNGNVAQGNFSPFTTGGGSAYFDGNEDSVSIPASSTITGDFVAEWFMYLTAINTVGTATIWLSNQSLDNFQLGIDGNTIGAWINGSLRVSGTVTASSLLNKWIHIAYVRTGSTLSIFVNGTRVATGTYSASVSNNTIYVGQQTPGGNNHFVTGYMSSVRLINGSNSYNATQSTLTVPTTPLTAVSGTSFLLNFTNASIVDSAPIANNLETVGNTQISNSVKKYGTGSIAFDGSGDWLKIPNNQNFNFNNGNFTVECWVYCTNTSPRQDIFSTPANSSGFNGLSIGIYNGNFELTSCWSSGSWQILWATAGAVNANTWYHLAVVRNGGTLTVYVNGTATYSNNTLNTNSLVFGTEPETIS